MEIIKCYFPYYDNIRSIYLIDDWQKYFIELVTDEEYLFKYNIQSRYSYIFGEYGFGRSDLINIVKKYFLSESILKNKIDYRLEYIEINNLRKIVNKVSDSDRGIMFLELKELFGLFEKIMKNIIDESFIIINEGLRDELNHEFNYGLKEKLREKVTELRYLNTVCKIFFYGIFYFSNLSFKCLIKFYDSLE